MATPSRNTRSSSRQGTPTALPAIDRKTSHGYGARGKANLSNQLAAAGTTLAEGFSTARAMDALLEESIVEEDEHIPQPQIQRQGTVVESFAAYEGSQRSQRSQKLPPPPPSPPPPAARRAASPPPPTEPWSLSVLLFAVPRYLWRNFWSLLLGALILGIVAHISLPESVAWRRDRFFHGMKHSIGVPGYDQPPTATEEHWMWFRYNVSLAEDYKDIPNIKDPALQGMINVRLRQMIRDAENNHTALFHRVEALEEFLPPRMVVDVVDDQLVIKEEFWNVLASKLRGDSGMFDAFVAANEKAATEIARAASEEHLSTAMNSKRVLTPEDMMEMLNEHASNLDKKLETWSGEQLAMVRTQATQIAKEVAQDAASDPRTQLSVLIKSKIIANIYDSLSAVNYFSPNMGAIVDPHHSSPTALKLSKKLGWFGKPLRQFTAPHVAAIKKWEETGECWCAAKSTGIKGKAQLAIITEHMIAPRRLIVEHIPRTGAQSIASAPQDIELWAEVFSVKEAEEWRRRFRMEHPQYDLECAEASPPTDTSVCIASGTYDIHAENWVQSFDTFIDMENRTPRMGAGKFYYRVMSNWRSEQTCTYRVRLTGQDIWELDNAPEAF
ncbi:hypothetical protein Q7P36_007915 [Cladosporium allicinum]